MFGYYGYYEAPSIHQINDKIWISNCEAAYSKKLLKERGITHILAAGNGLEKKFPGEFTYLHLRLNDIPSQNLFPTFKEAIKFIDQGQKVLVHCHAGISRSSSNVIAYLMWKNGWSYTEAYHYVKRGRPIVNPNPGFVNQLKRLEFQLKNGEFDLESPSTSTFSTTSAYSSPYKSSTLKSDTYSRTQPYKSSYGSFGNNTSSYKNLYEENNYASKYTAGANDTYTNYRSRLSKYDDDLDNYRSLLSKSQYGASKPYSGTSNTNTYSSPSSKLTSTVYSTNYSSTYSKPTRTYSTSRYLYY